MRIKCEILVYYKYLAFNNITLRTFNPDIIGTGIYELFRLNS